MFKVVWIARFGRGLTRDQGRKHWREIHGPLGAAVPGLDRYVQSHVVGSLPGADATAEPPFDGYSSGWFADRGAYDGAMASPEWAELAADSPNLFDRDFFCGMCAALDENQVRDGPMAPFKVAWIVRFRSDLGRDEARRHWRDVHGPLALEAPGIRRYVQNHAVEALAAGIRPGQPELGFDGFSECWFDSRADCQRALTSPGWAALAADGRAIFDYRRMWSAVLDENVVKN